ncbi:MAG: hypothetical protein IID44_25920 [Planctomycetes bacterium]|nr:hypothetical protein [Planctomycetota bacterium]
MKYLIFTIAVLNAGTACWLWATQAPESAVDLLAETVPESAGPEDAFKEIVALRVQLTAAKARLAPMDTYRLKSTISSAVLALNFIVMFVVLVVWYNEPKR